MAEPREPLARIELLQGTLDLIILQCLRRGPCHGYGLAKLIRSTSKDVLRIQTGSLYPALQRLAKKRWIKAEWAVSENGQRVREYRLTDAGRQRLEIERSRWERLSDAMARILAPPPEGSEA